MTWLLPRSDDEWGEWIQNTWQRYKAAASLSLLLLFGGIFAWQQYHQSQVKQSREASLLMSNLLDSVRTNQPLEKIEALAQQLATDYTQTPYTALAQMLVAKHYISQHQMDKGIQLYEQIISLSDDPAIKQIAHLRLARLWIAQANGKKALGVLSRVNHWDFQAPYLEVKGDALWQQQQPQQAFAAFDAALQALPKEASWQASAMRLAQKKNRALLKLQPKS